MQYAEPGRLRAVGEDVAEVAAAVGAQHLGAHHPVGWRRVSSSIDVLARRRENAGQPHPESYFASD